MAHGPVCRHSQTQRGTGAVEGDRVNRELDGSRTRRLLRRSRESIATAAPGIGRDVREGSDVLTVADDRVQHSRYGLGRRAGSELYALPSLLGHRYRGTVRLAGEAAL